MSLIPQHLAPSGDLTAIGIVGAGLMGGALAAVFASTGVAVTVYDSDSARIDELPGLVGRYLDDLRGAALTEVSTQDVLGRIQQTTRLADLAPLGFVLEAVPERLLLKKQVYAELEAVLASGAIIASNTSGLMPSALCAEMIHPERFLVAHFWNPPFAIPLVELVPGPQTPAETVNTVERLLLGSGFEPVTLVKELPGFIGNRLQYAVLREALAIVESGAASAEAVDHVMKASLGRRYATVGPLETADLGGLDTFYEIASHLMPQLDKGEGVLESLRHRVAQGRTGVRAGGGIYDWTPERAQAVIQRRNADLLRRRRQDQLERAEAEPNA
ncbi:3-hydroxyacyl-CoA dehydrogenase family protein [Deinococcus sp. SM5_A1]|uniref:3-hydroxyacyl-CoA dehydrogenase family protein n=1 Tax=Deinococcus sp. SM5_A1 TaxID=3379094 RepID=UPI003859BE0F